jgi:hypothetical protein
MYDFSEIFKKTLASWYSVQYASCRVCNSAYHRLCPRYEIDDGGIVLWRGYTPPPLKVQHICYPQNVITNARKLRCEDLVLVSTFFMFSMLLAGCWISWLALVG